MVKIFCALLPVFFAGGCRNYITRQYKLNRAFVFTGRQDYLNAVSRENGFDAASVLYVDSIHFNDFLQILNGTGTVYLGSFLNDSTAIKKSDLLKENESCIGRMESEIDKNIAIADLSSAALDTSLNLAHYTFYSVKDNRQVSITGGPKKITIVLLYTYAFGTLYTKLYNEIKKAYQKNTANAALYIITADPVYYLQK
jgi:hypothetical protein